MNYVKILYYEKKLKKNEYYFFHKIRFYNYTNNKYLY